MLNNRRYKGNYVRSKAVLAAILMLGFIILPQKYALCQQAIRDTFSEMCPEVEGFGYSTFPEGECIDSEEDFTEISPSDRVLVYAKDKKDLSRKLSLCKTNKCECVHIHGRRWLEGADLSQFFLENTAIRRLELIDIGTEATPAVLPLQHLKQLEILSVSHSCLDVSTMREISSLPFLRTLSLSGSRMSEDGVRELFHSKSIESLDLSATEPLELPRGRALSGIEKMSTLRRLSIADWGFRSEETRHLSQLEALSSLNAGDVHDGVEFCAGIRGMMHLQELCLRFSAPSRSINDRIVESIARLRGLQRLCMLEPNVSIKAFNRIAELPELRCLVLARHEGVPPQVEPAIVQRLSEMKGLSMIGLYGGWVTDECVSQLKPLKNIRYAQLRSSSLTAAGLRTVFENWQLDSLDLLSTSLTDEMIGMIGSKTMLRYLCIAGCGVSLNQAAELRRQLALCTVITE